MRLALPVRRRTLLQAPVLLAAGAVPATAGGTPSAKQAYLYFITPSNGQRFKGAVLVRFGLRNMGVAPAGVAAPNAGHHHLLVDAEDPLDPGTPIPADKSHMHFGAGQTETTLDLAPGTHTLQLVLGDANHMVFDPPVMSSKIRIRVG